jgi:predicted AAA+ superfamily ATPase
MIVQRNIEKKVVKRLESIPVVALLGSRQVGKTTLAKQIESQLQVETIYLDLESQEDIIKLSQPENYFNQRKDKLIIIDEIQRMPELFPILRTVVDKNRRNGRFIILGSASPELLLRSSESLAGRISYFELHPFSLTEVVGFSNYQELWLKGGYPEMLMAKDIETSFQNRLDFIKTYIERDLPLLGLKISPIRMRNFIRMVAHIHGNIINYSDFSRSMAINNQVVKDYFDFLEQSFLIIRLQPFYYNIKKRLVKTPKVFFKDSGIFHAVTGIESFEDLEGYIGKGNSWEGFVIQQIISVLKPNVEPYFYRTQDGAEIDLLLVKGNKPVLGIEIKYSNTPKISRGTTVSLNDLGNIPLLIITPSVNEEYQIADNKTVMSLESSFDYLKTQDLIDWNT